MAEFEYVAVDKKGKTRTGTLSAPDAKSARRKAMQSGLTVLKVKMSSGANTSQSSPGTQRQKRKESLRSKYSNKGEAIGLEFLRRLLELHGSGMPVADAVKLLNHRLSDPQQRNLSAVLWKELARGQNSFPCYEAIAWIFQRVFLLCDRSRRGNGQPGSHIKQDHFAP